MQYVKVVGITVLATWALGAIGIGLAVAAEWLDGVIGPVGAVMALLTGVAVLASSAAYFISRE